MGQWKLRGARLVRPTAADQHGHRGSDHRRTTTDSSTLFPTPWPDPAAGREPQEGTSDAGFEGNRRMPASLTAVQCPDRRGATADARRDQVGTLFANHRNPQRDARPGLVRQTLPVDMIP